MIAPFSKLPSSFFLTKKMLFILFVNFSVYRSKLRKIFSFDYKTVTSRIKVVVTGLLLW